MSSAWIRADWAAPSSIIAGTTLRNSEFELPASPQLLNQVHGIGVAHVGSVDSADGAPEADAIVGNRGGDICVVKTADCLPVLLCSADGQQIGAAHAGWRGLVAGVIEETIAAMSTNPAELIAWLGPAISQPAFEVGEEVREAFLATDAGAATHFVENARGRWQADLFGLAKQRLNNAGVTSIYGGGLCTFSDDSRFFSYRRDGSDGRLLSFVYRSP
jgi:YfiH family protein